MVKDDELNFMKELFRSLEDPSISGQRTYTDELIYKRFSNLFVKRKEYDEDSGKRLK